MNRKIEAYLDVLFADIPKSREAIELRAELSANLNDRMADYLAEGKGENQSYALAIASLGEVDELLETLSKGRETPTASRSESSYYRRRNAVLKSVAILLYILCPVPLISLAIVLPGLEELGVVALLGMVAVATAILVFTSASTPKEHRDVDDDDEVPFTNPHTQRQYKAISSLVMTVATLIFFLLGFLFSAWGRAWAVFPIAGIGLSIWKDVLRWKEDI